MLIDFQQIYLGHAGDGVAVVEQDDIPCVAILQKLEHNWGDWSDAAGGCAHSIEGDVPYER